MKNIFRSNVNWLIFSFFGVVLLYAVLKVQPENKYPMIISGLFLLGTGIFALIFPERRLLWLKKERVDLLTMGFACAFVVFAVLMSLGMLAGI